MEWGFGEADDGLGGWLRFGVIPGWPVIQTVPSESRSGRVGVRGLPGPQLRGSGGTLIVL